MCMYLTIFMVPIKNSAKELVTLGNMQTFKDSVLIKHMWI